MKNIIYELELTLLNKDSRKDPILLDKLIHEDFIEFGSSGKIYKKKETINSLLSESSRQFSIDNFQVKKLSPNVILATYFITEDNIQSLRSSIWLYNQNWQMIFHQGTKFNK